MLSFFGNPAKIHIMKSKKNNDNESCFIREYQETRQNW